MELFEAIHGRTSADSARPDPLPDALIEKLLAAGVQAPNHYKVRPWRFVVVRGHARERLGDAMAASLNTRHPELPPEAMDKTRRLPLRAAALIAVGVDRPAEPHVLEIENVCAAAAATQNILLAAEAENLAAKWRTGEWARDPAIKAFLGFSVDQHIIGFIYIGYRVADPDRRDRPSWEDRTRWMD